jgi:hypothetical protein
MLTLFFGDLFSILTTLLVLGLLVFIALTIKNRGTITKWGRLILIFILAGTAVSAFSATRDAYMMEGALFSASSIQSTICSVAGGAIFLTGLISIFVRKQTFRRAVFHLISAFFVVQVLTIEISRAVII